MPGWMAPCGGLTGMKWALNEAPYEKEGVFFVALGRRKLRGRSGSIRFEKGDTLGGTASLLLLNQIGGGVRGKSQVGRRRAGSAGRVLGKILSFLLLVVGVGALFLLGWDWIEEFIRVQVLPYLNGS